MLCVYVGGRLWLCVCVSVVVQEYKVYGGVVVCMCVCVVRRNVWCVCMCVLCVCVCVWYMGL